MKILRLNKTFRFRLSAFRLNHGQFLIEVLVAMGLATILLPAILTGFVASREGKSQEEQRIQAQALLQEAQEAVRSVREKGFSNIATNGTYHPAGDYYKVSLCERVSNFCQTEYDTFTGPSNGSGQLSANFTYTNPQVAFEVWAAKDPVTTGCVGLACFALSPYISSMTITNLNPGTTYTVAICDYQNVNCGTLYDTDVQTADSSGKITANFYYPNKIIVEVFVAKDPVTTGCVGLACFAGVNPLVQNITISGLNPGTTWSLAPGEETIQGFTRKIEISDTMRDLQTSNILENGGQTDPSTKKIVSTVSWTSPTASQVQSTIYLSRYVGNTTWVQTTSSDFNAGTHLGTKVVANGNGAVELDISTPPRDYGNKFLVTNFSDIGYMTSINNKTSLRFTAQTTQAISAIKVLVGTKSGQNRNWRFGIQTNGAGNSPSGTWAGLPTTVQINSPGWKTINLGSTANLNANSVYHLVIEPASTPATNAYIGIKASLPLNGLYPKTNSPDPNANTLFRLCTPTCAWTTLGLQPIYILEGTSNTEGNSYDTRQTESIYGNSYFGEKFTVTGSSKIAQSISFYTRRVGTPADDLKLELRDSNNQVIYTGTVGNTSSSASFTWLTHNFTPSTLTLNSGSTYRIILKSPLSNANNNYQIYRIETNNDPVFNSITYDGINSIYTNSADSGNNWADKNHQDVGGFYFKVQEPPYLANGEFTSQIFNLLNQVAFNNITWTANIPPLTNIQLQVSTDGGNTFFGSDGIGSYYTSPGPIPINFVNGQSIKFKAILTGNGTETPTLMDVSINYSP